MSHFCHRGGAPEHKCYTEGAADSSSVCGGHEAEREAEGRVSGCARRGAARVRGEVYLVVQVLPHSLFGWEGDDLRRRMADGNEVRVLTLDRCVMLTASWASLAWQTIGLLSGRWGQGAYGAVASLANMMCNRGRAGYEYESFH